MKQLFIVLIALISANIISAQSKKPADYVKFNSESVDLGKAKLGNPVTATFTFTNTSKDDVIIEMVTPGCGCTKSDYTKEPIKPGKTGTITATYNAAAIGNFSKKIYVKFMSVEAQQELTIVGVVEQ